MQTPYRESSGGRGSPLRSVAILAIFLFALSGLLSGFAFGAFGHAHTKPGQTNTPQGPNSPTQHRSPTATVTKPEQPVYLGVPPVPAVSNLQVADGQTTYTFSAQIVNKNPVTPITASDVTCKLWLTRDNDATKMLSANKYAIPDAIDSIQNPFPDEVPASLNFNTSTPQTQKCSTTSLTTWNYTVSSSVKKGTYYMVVLADWKGIHFNWNIVSIKIKNG